MQKDIRELFPDGKPEPEEFIRVMAQLVREQLRERERSQGGILAGGDFGASQNTTACPLTERHG